MRVRQIVFLTGIVLLSAGVASAQAIITSFTGQTVSKTTFLSFGTFSCPGGEPAGPFPPYAPCSEGSRVNFRGVVFQHSEVATDSRMTGTMQVVFNGNTDGWTQGPPAGPGQGPVWGTWHMDVAEGGEWDGTYTGYREITEAGNVLSTLRFQGEGTGGRIERAKVHFEVSSPHNAPSTFEGRILELPAGTN